MVVASLIDSLSKVGAITGIVSFVGIGLLILLVAAQSRQIRAMREWIDAEPERQADTAQRVIAEVQRRIAAARERRAAQAAAPAAAAAPVPPTPRQVPPAPGTLGATPEARAVAAAKAADTVSAPGEVDPTAGSVPPPTQGDDATGEPPVFAPLTPAADAEAAPAPPVDDAGEPPVLDALGEPIITSEPGQDTQPADALPADYDPLAAATPIAQGNDPRFADEHFALDDHFHDDEEHPRGNRLLFGIGAVALLAGIVLAATLLFGGGSDDTKAPATGGSGSTSSQGDTGGGSGSGAKPTPTPVDPASVRVMVLNGTQVNGLAQQVTDTLSGKGYGTSQPNTFSSDQTLTTTTVQYREGHATDARQVAKDLGLQSSAAQPINADVSAAAPETAAVVVVTGQDLAGSSGASGASGTTG
jgi:hypothetical protein